MSIKYSSIYASKDLSNIDDLLESYIFSVNKSIDVIMDYNKHKKCEKNTYISIWNVNGPLLSDINCLKNVESSINANRFYSCVGCKVLHQLNIEAVEKAYLIEFGNMQGCEVHLSSKNMISVLLEIRENGKYLNKLLHESIGGCDLSHVVPNIMVGVDEFTNNVVISHILSQNIEWVSRIYFSYICNNKGYMLTDKSLNIEEYINQHPEHVENIFQQLISFYKKCRQYKYQFNHGNPTLSALVIKETKEGPILKIKDFENSSISYTTNDNKKLRIHPKGDIPNMYTLKSTLKFNIDRNTYKILYHNKMLINSLHKVGIPLFNESYDLYYFIAYLSRVSEFYNYFIDSLLFEKIFLPADNKIFISTYNQVDPHLSLIGLDLYCNVLDKI